MKYEKIKVVMLPTNEKAIIIKEKITNKLKISSLNNPQRWEYQHLYFLSDEEIKEGDWVYNSGQNIVFKWPNHYVKANIKGEHLKKIIATTDRTLHYKISLPHGEGEQSLPRPSNEFLKKYCELGGIDEVLVEYEEYDWNEYTDTYWNSKLKVAPDNTITIKSIKDSWNREEVIDLIRNSHEDYHEHPNDLENWIKQNL